MPTTFMTLPAELRLMVYGHLLPESNDSEFDIASFSSYDNIQAIEAPYKWLTTNRQVYGEGLDIIFSSGQVVIKTPSDMSTHIDHLKRATTIVVKCNILETGTYASDWIDDPTWRILRTLPRLKHLILCDQWTTKPSEFVTPSFRAGFPKLESITLRDLDFEAKVLEVEKWLVKGCGPVDTPRILRAKRIFKERERAALEGVRDEMEHENRMMQTGLELRV